MTDRNSALPERLSALPERLSAMFRPRRNWRKIAGRVAATGALTVVFGAATITAALLHINERPIRRLTQVLVTRALGDVFHGKIIVGQVDLLGFREARIAEAWVLDPAGREIITARGISARFSTMRLLRSLLLRDDTIWIQFPSINIDDATVRLIPSEADPVIPTIADAFIPKDDGGPSDPTARPILLNMPKIAIRDAIVVGKVSLPLDARVSRLSGSVSFVDGIVAVDIEPTGIQEKTFLPFETSGVAAYHLRVDTNVDLDAPPPPQVDMEGLALESSPLRMWADLTGAIGSLPVVVRAEINGDHIDLKATLPEVAEAGVKTVLPWLPFRGGAKGSATLEGTFPDLAIEGALEIPQGAGVGTIVVDGRLRTEAEPLLELRFDATEIDPRAFDDRIPETRVSARALVGVKIVEPSPVVHVEAATNAFVASGVVVPAMDLSLDLVNGTLIGSADVHEPGVDTDARFAMDEAGKITFGVDASVSSFAEALRLGGALNGSAKVSVQGSFADGVVDATARGSFGGLQTSGFKSEQGTVTARVIGKPEALSVTASTKMKGIVAAGEHFDALDATVDGPLLKPRVKVSARDADLGALEASGAIDVEKGAASGVKFKLDRNGAVAEGSASYVGARDGGVEVRGIAISGEGLGKIGGDLRMQNGELSGSLRAENLGLAKLAAITGIPAVAGGVANVDIEMSRTGRNGRKGHVEIEIEDGDAFLVSGISARVSTRFDDDKVETSGFVRLIAKASDEERQSALKKGLLAQTALCDGPVAEFRFSDGKGTVAGPIADVATWEAAEGEVDIALENWNLGCLAKLAPFGLPVDEVSGTLTARAHLERGTGDVLPTITDLFVRTRGLEVAAGKPTLFFGGKSEPWESRKIDAQLRGSLDGATGVAGAEVTLFDGTLLAEVGGETKIDPDRVRKGDALLDILQQAPTSAKLWFPRRSLAELDTLPSFAQKYVPALSGDVRIDAELNGSIERPVVTAKVEGFGLTPVSESGVGSRWAPPLDFELSTRFDLEARRAAFGALFSHDGKGVANVNGGVYLKKEDAPADAPPWTAGALATFYALPLGSLPALSDRDVQGHVSGTVLISDVNANPSIEVKLLVPDLELGGESFSARVTAAVKPSDGSEEAPPPADAGAIDAAATQKPVPGGNATVEFELEDQSGGNLSAIAFAGVQWTDGFIPGFAEHRPGGLALSSKATRLAVVHPLVIGTLSKFDGYIDGKLAVSWGQVGDTANGRLEGGFTVRDAVAFIPQFGQELRGGKAKIVAGEGGLVRIEDIEARGVTGSIRGSGTAKFEGILWKSAEGSFTIGDDDDIPVTYEGVPLGKARGKIDVVAQHTEGRVDFTMRIPTARLELPASSSRSVQALAEDPTITLTLPMGPEKEKRSKDAMVFGLDVYMDDFEVTSSILQIFLTSPTENTKIVPVHVELAEELSVSGAVRVKRGYLELRGKRFELDEGFVRLRPEEPGNPTVFMSAHWDTPDGGRVFIDYSGNLLPITDEKLRFRSDPPRSKQEIATILLFGTDLSTTPTTQGLGIGRVGGGIAAEFVAGALNDVLGSETVNALLDVNEEGELRGGVAWRPVDSLTLGATTNRTAAATGGSSAAASASAAANRTGQQIDLFVDWKLTPRLSLRSSFGSAFYYDGSGQRPNTGVDLIWQLRY